MVEFTFVALARWPTGNFDGLSFVHKLTAMEDAQKGRISLTNHASAPLLTDIWDQMCGISLETLSTEVLVEIYGVPTVLDEFIEL